jgi:hypothetical protein
VLSVHGAGSSSSVVTERGPKVERARLALMRAAMPLSAAHGTASRIAVSSNTPTLRIGKAGGSGEEVVRRNDGRHASISSF